MYFLIHCLQICSFQVSRLKFVCIFQFLHACYMYKPFHFTWLDYRNNVCCKSGKLRSCFHIHLNLLDPVQKADTNKKFLNEISKEFNCDIYCGISRIVKIIVCWFCRMKRDNQCYFLCLVSEQREFFTCSCRKSTSSVLEAQKHLLFLHRKHACC